MNWVDFGAAMALLAVVEGLIPFFSPRGYKNMVQQLAMLPDSTLRYTGLSLMLVGLIVLYLVRG